MVGNVDQMEEAVEDTPRMYIHHDQDVNCQMLESNVKSQKKKIISGRTRQL